MRLVSTQFCLPVNFHPNFNLSGIAMKKCLPEVLKVEPPGNFVSLLEAFSFIRHHGSAHQMKGGFHMRKIVSLLWIFLLFPSTTWAQDKIEAPVWNVGDKWVFTQGSIEVVGADENSRTLAFSKDTCVIENKGLEKLVYDKSTLDRTYGVKEGKSEKYAIAMRRMLNFPFNLGQEWSDTFSAKALVGPYTGTLVDFSEAFKIVGWENVQVQAGNFKAIRLEYNQKALSLGFEGTAIYWYAPEVKYFVKCQYDSFYFPGVHDWELVSFKLNK
jgi:hypothetical protein